MDAAPVRFLAIIAGTILWYVGAVLQKRAVQSLPPGKPRVADLARSAGWMAGLAVTGIGWGLYMLGLERVPVSVARAITAGGYAVLALFSTLFLKTPLTLKEWLAVAGVTAGIVMLGLGDPAQGAAAGAGAAAPAVVAATAATAMPRIGPLALGVGCVLGLVAALALASRLARRSPRSPLAPVIVFAGFSGLLSSVGDLFAKVLLAVPGMPAGAPTRFLVGGAAAAGLALFYLIGFYMLSRAYQVGTVVAGVVISDLFARAGAIFLGAVVLSEPLVGLGAAGLLRVAGFLIVLGCSLLLGRFGQPVADGVGG
jgi:drug/metabolite transporter (DMT)-like permease